MSLIIAAIAAAGAAGFTAAALALRRRAARRRLQQTAATASAVAPVDARPARAQPAATGADHNGPRPVALAVNLGDVVQRYDTSRWLRSAVYVWESGQLRCALLFTDDDGRQEPVVAFAPPQQQLYWLSPTEAVLPAQPPSCIELEDHLFDRRASFPVSLRPVGPTPQGLCGNGVLSFYEAAVGDVAVLVHCGTTRTAYIGTKLEAADYDRLGAVDPTTDELGAT